MAAQRSSAEVKIDAVEIEASDALLAAGNFANSPWSSRIRLHHTPIQKFFPHKKYDLIVSNPPYFNNSQRPPGESRHQARHTIALSYDELMDATLRLLNDNGKLNVILPYAEGLQFIDLARQSQLFCSRQYSFKTRPEKPVERWLLEFSRRERDTEMGEILLYKAAEAWSDEYVKLTADFYLKS
jgi:tRNA1Val (adenine37-N6)-methyltransferase